MKNLSICHYRIFFCNRMFVSLLLLLMALLMTVPSDAHNNKEDSFFIRVRPSEYGDRFIKIQGYLPNDIDASYFSLRIDGYENGIAIEQREIPMRSVPEFNIRVTSTREYLFIMYAYDKHKDLLMESGISEISGGYFIGELKGYTKTIKPLIRPHSRIARSGGIEVEIVELICNNFPNINVMATVKDNGTGVQNLTSQNFKVLENGLSPSGSINIYPPKDIAGERIADFAFVFDQSYSMEDDLTHLRSVIGQFITELKQSNISYNLAFVPFEFSPVIIQDMTADENTFLNSIDNFLNNYPGGLTENSFSALNVSINSLKWRPGSQKILVLLTDEDDDYGGPTLDEIGEILVNAQTTVYGVVDATFEDSYYDFCATGSVTNVTSGKCYNITDPYLDFTDILDEITQQVAQKYTIAYRSSDLNIQSGPREVHLTVSYNGNDITAIRNYDPAMCKQIRIDLTPETSDLLLNTINRKNIILEISAKVVTANQSNPLTAILHFKNAQTGYHNIQMNQKTDGIYSAIIPADIIIDPFVKFYISATDGSVTVTLPSVNAADSPYVFGVLPNIPPQIAHTPSASASPDSDIVIQASIEDSTSKVDSATLYYRKKGNNLYISIQMNNITGTQYEAKVPGIAVKAPGIEYYIESQDDYNAKSSLGTADNPMFVFVSEDDVIPGDHIDVGKLRVWGDQIISSDMNTFDVSGNVKIGTVNGNTPLIGFDSAVEVDMDITKVKSKGKTNATALKIKRNPQKPEEDIPLWYGTFDANGLTAELKLGNDVISTFRYIARFLLGWCQFCSTKPKIILNDDNTIVCKKLAVELNSLNTIAEIPDIVLDPSGNNSTGKIVLKPEDFDDPEFMIKGISIEEFVFELDFVRRTITLGGTVGFGKRVKLPKGPVLNINSIGLQFDLLLDPFYLDGIQADANLREPNFSHLGVLSFPQSPPTQFGIAPTGFSLGVQNISGGIGNLRLLGSVKGALCDQLLIEQSLKALLDIWAVNGEFAIIIDLSGSVELTGEAFLMGLVEVTGKSFITITGNNVSSGVEGKTVLLSEDFDVLKGRVSLNSALSLNPATFTISGSSNMKLKIPDKAPLFGGLKILSQPTKGLIIVKEDNGISIEKAEFSASFKLMFASATVRVDLADPKACVDEWCLRFRKTREEVYSSKPILNENGKVLYITGYETISSLKIPSLSGSSGRSSKNIKRVEVPSGQEVVFIRIVSEQDVPSFNITFPDGTIYQPQDAPPDPDSPLKDIVFFNSNQEIHESYWAINQPQGGQYKLTINNEASLGQYDIFVVKQNNKPEITINVPTGDINATPGDTVIISWTATATDDAKISLFYDTDNIDFNGGLIVSGIIDDTISYQWTLPEGLYGPIYIYAVIDDGKLGPAYAYSSGRFVLPDPTGPSVPENIVATAGDGSARVSWDLNDPSEKVSLYKVYLNADDAIYTYVVENPPFRLDNLASNNNYKFAVAAIDENGNVSKKSAEYEITPLGISTDGPPDLAFDEFINVISSLPEVVTITATVNNIGDYPAFGYKVACWHDSIDDNHLLGEVTMGTLGAKSSKEIVFNCDTTKLGSLSDPKTIFLQIKDTVLPELNESNNIAMAKRTIHVPSPDTDEDGTPDETDGCPSDPNKVIEGICGCGIPDTDTDEDGTPDCNDKCPTDPKKTEPGNNGCGVSDTGTGSSGQSGGAGDSNCFINTSANSFFRAW